MAKFHDLVQSNPRQLSDAVARSMEQSILRFLTYWQNYGGHEVFKHHVAIHCVMQSRRLGNPRCRWTYADENENRLMGSAAKSVHHGDTFYVTLMQKLPGFFWPVQQPRLTCGEGWGREAAG
eukprot:6938650-Pyramimonas_sp.AAC.1